MVANRKRRTPLTLVDKEKQQAQDKAEAAAAEASSDPAIPPFEIDPEVPLEYQLAETKAMLEGLKMGRFVYKSRYRVNKFSLKNEQAASAVMEDLVKQESAIMDWEENVKIVQAAVDKQKAEAEKKADSI